MKLIPAHQCYVEMFSGAAWVLFAKDHTTSDSEVLNDLDGELVNFWRVVKHRPAEFTEAASWLLPSRELFDAQKSLPSVGGEIARAVRFFFVLRLSFGGRRMRPSYGFKRKRRPNLEWATAKDEVQKIVERLRIVWVERLSWERLLDTYDRPATFFYVDPPYRCDGAKAYRHFFTDEDHARLADRLLGARGKWLLSYNDDRFIRQLYRHRKVHVRTVEVPYTLARHGGRRRVTELLLSNYSLPAAQP